MRGDFNVYFYDIDNFIFGDRTDEVADNLPVLHFIQGDSRFVGFDAKGSVRLGGQAWATLGIGRVDAALTTTNEPLPRIPPLRGTLSLDIPYGGFTLSPQLEFAGQQADVFRDATKKKLVVTTDSGRLNPRASVPGRRHAAPRFHAAGSGKAGWGTIKREISYLTLYNRECEETRWSLA